jgi:hypothetical protein
LMGISGFGFARKKALRSVHLRCLVETKRDPSSLRSSG